MNWLAQTIDRLGGLFAKDPLVLVDVGASGAPPQAWRDLAPIATYVGFDPDLRELRESNDFGFRRFIMVDKAITPQSQSSVEFFLTASPYCSSVLRPNPPVLAEYSFTALFDVERTASVQATTMREALTASGLTRIDWIKLDTQGIDLDIIEAFDAPLHDALLAVDIEPGVDEFYVAENTFTQAHEQLMKRDFWLADAHLQSYPRISVQTREWLASSGRTVDYDLFPGNPTAIEALYYRTREHLARHATPRDLAAAWIIAMLNGHYGFALDVAVAFIALEPNDSTGTWMVDIAAEQAASDTRARSLKLRRTLYAWTPDALRPFARKVRSAIRRR